MMSGIDNSFEGCSSIDWSGGYVDGNPKTAEGRKKTPLHLIPPIAMQAEAEVMGLGEKKYGAFNWRGHTVSASVYYSAAMRHLLAWYEGEEEDPESGQSHLAHVRACMGILLDADANDNLNDDRP
ncbi:MAG: dATP/dGTP diphosphohydrolase domain-containing protein [Sneathiella sp.]